MPDRPYFIGSSGKCPHCQTVVLFDAAPIIRGYPILVAECGGDYVYVYSSLCPNCERPIVMAEVEAHGRRYIRYVHPSSIIHSLPSDVPKEIADDFLEAAAVLPVSQKASAALSRRCLQNLLTHNGYKQKDLHNQIDAAIKDLPERIGRNLDAIRVIGNFAAHPMKHKSTGALVEVEPDEASWNLEVLRDLLEYYYVQLKNAEMKRKKLDSKLKRIGKPPMKKP